MKNNFNILAHIPVDLKNTKRIVEFKGFQEKVKSDCQESMDSTNKAADNPTANNPPPVPLPPPNGSFNQA